MSRTEGADRERGCQQSVEHVIVGSLTDTVADVPATARRRARSAPASGRTASGVVAMLTLVLGLAACGTSELEIAPRFDGNWLVTALFDAGSAVDLEGQSPQIEIDTGEAAVRGRTNCRELFGSYTLVDASSGEGEASFTIPSPAAGASCDPADRAVHTILVETLESVTQWRQEGSLLTFQRQDQTVLELTPAG